MEEKLQEQKFTIAVVGLVYNDENKFIVIKRGSLEDNAPNAFSYPGGKVEYQTPEMDILENNCIREIKEETNLEVIDAEYLSSHSFQKSNGDMVVVVAFLAKYLSGDITKFDTKEVSEISWKNIDEINNLDTIDVIKKVYNAAYQKLSKRKVLHHLEVAGIVLNKKNECLVVKYKNNDNYSIPRANVQYLTGKIWEVLKQNLSQEILIQTGIEIEDGAIPFTDQSFVDNDSFDAITQFFICKSMTDTIMKSDMMDDAKWITRDELMKIELLNNDKLVFEKAYKFLENLNQ